MAARLRCPVQNYAWGVESPAGEVARLAGATDTAGEPHAELWMGTHPSGPAKIAAGAGEEGPSLASWLGSKSERRGDVTLAFGADFEGATEVEAEGAAGGNKGLLLPYLFKVLSVAKALSIQAHPDRALAKQLHAERPDVYRDANHKPEMAIALSERFEALCGFRRVEEIQEFLVSVPELRAAVGDAVADQFADIKGGAPGDAARKDGLRALLGALVGNPADAVAAQIQKLVQRLEAKGAEATELERVVLRVNSQFPGDNGVLCCYILNFLVLKRGEALFLGANEPHAYLAGDCAECMAASDNVVRAGLTPKLKDKDVLVSMLTCTEGVPKLVAPVQEGHTTIIRPPIPEFQFEHTKMSPGDTQDSPLPVSKCASILLCFRGGVKIEVKAAGGDVDVMDLSAGDVLCIEAGAAVSIPNTKVGIEEPVELIRCSVNSELA